MATDSITHNFVLDEETSLRFVNALWETKKNYVPLGRDIVLEHRTPEEIELMVQKEVKANKR